VSGENGSTDGGTGSGKAPEGGTTPPEGGEKTFTQAELDAKISERLKRERAKFADYDDLKAKAKGSQTAEQQLAELQQQLAETQRETLKRRVQASFGISDDDADLFLTGTDEETLKRQAKRLKDRDEELAKNGGRVPGEGHNGRPKVTDEKKAVRTLFGTPG
jgi:hypothetical protein